ncbi:MAG: hypothetical protein ACOC1F_09365, partial [Myxococcota bacterium]
MGPVPWQVAYGHWIGWTAGALLVALGAILFWMWVRWVAKKQGAARLSNLGAGTTEVTDGPVVLRGRIEVPGAPVPSLDGSGAAAVCTVEASSQTLRYAPHDSHASKSFRAPSLRIVTPKGEATVRGPVRVVRGSRETFPGRLTNLDDDDQQRLTSSSDEGFGTQNWPNRLRVPAVIRTLRHGDEVVARGVMQRNLGNGGPGASYRPMETAFELVAGEETDSVEILATSPASLSFGKKALFGRGLAVGLLLSLTVGIAFGGAARRVGDFATAALFPPHRVWAIDALAQEVAAGTPSEQRLAAVLAYDEVQSDCRRTGTALLKHGRWKRAGDVLSKCEDDASKLQAVTAYRMAGSLKKACRSLEALGTVPAGTDEILVLALGGCTDSAAAALRRAAEMAPDSRAQTLRCLADGMAARAGDEQARKRLASERSEACQLVHADDRIGPQRLAALSYLQEAPPTERAEHRHALLQAVLAASAGKVDRTVSLPALPPVTALLVDPRQAWKGRAHGLEAEVLKSLALVREPTPEERSLRMVLAIRAAAFEIFSGNHDDAARLLDVARADIAAALRRIAGEIVF